MYVSIDGIYALISAWGDDDNGYNSGSAYILEAEEVSLRVIEKQQENDLPDQSQNGDNEPTNNTQLDVPTEYIVALIVIIIILITLIAYRITKKNNESSPVPISSD